METKIKKYVVLSYLVFWFMVLGICGTASMVFHCPPVVMRILSNVCAWAPTIVLLVGFKFFCPKETIKDFYKRAFGLGIIGIIGGLLCAVADLAVDVIQSVFRQIYVPFFTLYSMLVIIPAMAVMGLIIGGLIQAPLWCVILNPVVFQLIGLIFRATKLDIFIDAPSCCAASLGLAAYGLLAVICL